MKTARIFAIPKAIRVIQKFLKREHSSAGSEHLPYKQRVRGSIPCAPTQQQKASQMRGFFIFCLP